MRKRGSSPQRADEEKRRPEAPAAAVLGKAFDSSSFRLITSACGREAHNLSVGGSKAHNLSVRKSMTHNLNMQKRGA